MKVLILLSVIVWSGFISANVEVTIAGQTYHYEGNPRLTEVLAPIVNIQDWYWAGVSVFKLDSAESNSMKNAAVQQLKELQTQDIRNQSNYQNIINQLNSWQLYRRIDIVIDYELARIQMRKNPAFADGSYLIHLSTRSNNLYIEGAVTNTAVFDYKENTCISTYLADVSSLDIASKDFVYLIQPNGRIETVGIAYWNSKCVLPMPGSHIFVPLAESPIFSDTATINQLVARLLSNRKLNK